MIDAQSSMPGPGSMDPIDTPDKLRAARLRLDWTQAKLAAELGKSLSLIQKMEEGESPIPRRTALAVRIILDDHAIG